MSLSDLVQRLNDLEDLRRLKASYFYYLDVKDRDGWLSLWAPDGTFQSESAVSAGGQDGKPRRKYIGKALREVWTDGQDLAQTVHMGHCPLLDVLSDSQARGIWTVEFIAHLPNEEHHCYGHYHETYRKIGGDWKFSTVYLKALRMTVTQR